MAFLLLLLAVTATQAVFYIPLASAPSSCDTFLKLELISQPDGIRSVCLFFLLGSCHLT